MTLSSIYRKRIREALNPRYLKESQLELQKSMASSHGPLKQYEKTLKGISHQQ